MSYVDKQDLREQVSQINDTNPMKRLIRNLVTRITRNQTVNLINIRHVFFEHFERFTDIDNMNRFIETINNYFSVLVPVERVISFPLFKEWVKNRNRKKYSDFTLSEEPHLREEMMGESKRQMTSAVASSPPPAMMRQESISDGVDPVWQEIMEAVFSTTQEGQTPASGEDIARAFYGKDRWRPPIGTSIRDKAKLERDMTLEMANRAKERRYAREGRPPPKPYKGFGKTRKRKKTKKRKYKKRRRKRTKRKRRMKRKKNKKK